MIGARPAVATDLDQLVELIHMGVAEATSKRGGHEWDLYDRYRREPFVDELLEDLTTRQRCLVLCGTIDDQVVGFATLVRRGTQARLVELFTHPRARRVGVGTALLTAAADTAAGAGCSELESVALPGDRETKNFFESHAMKSRLLVVGRHLSNGD